MAKKNKRTAQRAAARSPQAGSAPAKQYTPKSAAVQPPPKPKRTVAFIIAVAYVVIHGLVWSAALFATNRASVDRNPIIFYLLLATSLADVAAGVGMWFWQKWAPGLFLATSMLTAGFVTLVSGSLWLGMGALIPAIVVAYVTLPKVTQATQANAA
jgi:hypothetical protein